MQNIKQGPKPVCRSGGLHPVTIFFYKKFGLIATSALVANLGVDCRYHVAVAGGQRQYAGDCGYRVNPAVAVDANVLINERIKEELKVMAARYSRR